MISSALTSGAVAVATAGVAAGLFSSADQTGRHSAESIAIWANRCIFSDLNDLIRVDIGRSRSGDRRSCRGFVLVGGPDRQTQRRKHCHLGESMHFSPL